MSSVGRRDKTNLSLDIVVNECAIGTPDGVTTVFQTASTFLPGTLEVYLDGSKLNGDKSDTDRDYDELSDNQSFQFRLDAENPNRMSVPPCQSEKILVSYVKASSLDPC